MNNLPLLVLTLMVCQLLGGCQANNYICTVAQKKFRKKMNYKPINEQCKAVHVLTGIFRVFNCKMGLGLFAYVNYCRLMYND